MASKNSKQLIGNSGLLTKQDHDELNYQSRQLEQVRLDLEGMAYERVILDVITRDAIVSAKRKGKVNFDKNKSNYPNNITRGKEPTTQKPLRNSKVPNTIKPITTSSSSTTISSNLPIPTGITPNDNIDDFIPIPSFHSQPTSQQTNPSIPTNSINLPTKRNIPSSQHTSLTIGSKTSKMRQGSLPPEIAFLVTDNITDKKPTLRNKGLVVFYYLYLLLSTLICWIFRTGNNKLKDSIKKNQKKTADNIKKMKKEIEDFEQRFLYHLFLYFFNYLFL